MKRLGQLSDAPLLFDPLLNYVWFRCRDRTESYTTLGLGCRTLVFPVASRFIHGARPCPHVSKCIAGVPSQVLKVARNFREFPLLAGTSLEG